MSVVEVPPRKERDAEVLPRNDSRCDADRSIVVVSSGWVFVRRAAVRLQEKNQFLLGVVSDLTFISIFEILS